ncbi:OLC1v1026190C1 [Oldenlandia corymbosa var. corymbosa]|uniref:OLC1v1026190C1 n=1 Tax=Oldenlandia corymbosa var. corymbosa TaxID=529605 RepID=A0AAV1C6K0_OLDCO|nr:OLC1v1026190C1 [Oldenlandia corymbosa var. corymbosa]
MSPALISMDSNSAIRNCGTTAKDDKYLKGVKYVCEETGPLTRVPNKYVLPSSDRPNSSERNPHVVINKANLDLPVIDFAELRGPNRSNVLQSLSQACKDYGFFQLINHGISEAIVREMKEATRRFFELPYEERAKYMSSDVYTPVRYGTSFNQSKDKVFSWRDFLKITNPTSLPSTSSCWPSSPLDFRKAVLNYSNETKLLYVMIMEAILESLGLLDSEIPKEVMKEIEEGSQVMILNCYPTCPEPDLTLGMPPHSDYGMLTLLLQDEVKGLQIQHGGKWLTVEPSSPYSFVVNVGDHLEIFSNGKYKSVLHRVLVNSISSRISIASLHSLPFHCTVRPSPELVNEDNPKRYKDTSFADFLHYISSCEPKSKNFLESRKLL